MIRTRDYVSLTGAKNYKLGVENDLDLVKSRSFSIIFCYVSLIICIKCDAEYEPIGAYYNPTNKNELNIAREYWEYIWSMSGAIFNFFKTAT